MSAKKRICLSVKQKLSIINEIKDSSKQAICKKYGCSIDTVNHILRNKNSIIQSSKICNMSRKKDRVGKSKKLEKALSKWFDQMRSSGAVVSTNMLMEKAKQFAIALKENVDPTPAWLYRWQRREGINLRKIHGEAGSADKQAADNFQEILPNLTAGYKQSDIFNADETGLLFRALPSSTLNRGSFKISGMKSPKERITILLLCNATGDYKKMFAIGKPKQPRCFKNKKIPIRYFSQKMAWMTQDIWTEIMVAFDEEMIQQNKKVLLFVDNATAHKNISLKNVDVRYLPANSTSILQPLDQGIIHAFKAYYRQNIIRKQICFLESGKNIEDFKKTLDMLAALYIAKRAYWMVTPNTIFNCFKKVILISKFIFPVCITFNFVQCKFVPESHEVPAMENREDEIVITADSGSELGAEFENFVCIDENLPCYAPPNEEEIISELQSSEDDEDDASEDDDDIDECVPTPSVSNAVEYLNGLRCFLQARNGCVDELEKIQQFIFESCCKNVQMKITDFFKN